MGLFHSRKPPVSPPPVPAARIPVSQIDLNKRYDVYCCLSKEERLYENVRFLGIRTFDRIGEFSSGLIGGFLEIEAANGSTILLPNFGIQMICEHGTKPTYRVMKRSPCDP